MDHIKTKLSIICPTFNEASRLPLLLADINLWPYEIDIQVVDCGSKDKTQIIAKLFGANILETNTPNRGKQLNEGEKNSVGDWLLFLHADSRLTPEWPKVLIELMNINSSCNYAWYFDFKINERRADLRLLEIAVNLRSSFMQRPYGDQGLFISKDLYRKSGGYSDLHIMEDLDLITRLSKNTKLRRIGLPIYTDSKKWKEVNVIKQSIKNANLRSRWIRGESSESLAKEYYGN